jgi:citrate lyase subunit beta/citryl-CoA lyase
MLEKAASLDVDEVILDLEDSVPQARKNDVTRKTVIDALGQRDWRARICAVRVNAPGTAWFEDDLRSLASLAGGRLDAVVVPKVESAQAVLAADAMLSQLGLARVALEAQIESAIGLLHVEAIAGASPRLEALVFGPGDYAASLGISQPVLGGLDPSYPGDQWQYARSRIAVAAHAYDLDAIDGPYADYRDTAGLVAIARLGRAVGCTGKWVIHPDQIEPCAAVFAPSADEVEQATRVLAALDEAARSGRGAAKLDGRMVDEASRRAAEIVLERSGS